MLIKKIISLILLILITNYLMASKKIANINDIKINIRKLKSCVKFLTEIRPYRRFGNIESLDKTANYILKKFKKYGKSAEYQIFKADNIAHKNVLCYIGPEQGPRLIIGAHYDVCGDQPGADDNASAVAGMLEILRIVSSVSKQLKYRIDFAAYCLEEPPHFGTENMGSYQHAKFLKESGIHVKAMICLEMIGFFTEEEHSQRFPAAPMKLIYPSKGNFIAIVANMDSSSLSAELQEYMKQSNIDVQRLVATSFLPGIDFSDHRSFWEFGFEAVMITDTAFYRNYNYHKITDAIHTLDFDKMSETTKALAWAIINLK